jgi:Fe-S-cluster containining protein
MEIQAKKMGISLTILPRLGIGKNKHGNGPKKVIAYQMMGKNLDGSLCPFLDTKSSQRSPHGGYTCQIYEKRPLACCAYPIIAVNNVYTTLDGKCQFCKKNSSANSEKFGLQQEIRALMKISAEFFVDEKTQVWRYATAIGDEKDKTKFFPEGWIPEEV